MRVVRAALVGGPMYDPLYHAAFADFEADFGVRVEVVVRLPHPELNAWVDDRFGAGGGGVDLLSTHTKYAPSQAQWLSPLDDAVTSEHLGDLLPRPMELSRINGQLLQVPRNIDVRLLHYRRDLMPDDGVPATWAELAERASALTSTERSGFLFPGRDSGLFGTFYELLVSAGGDLFDERLNPAFVSPAGVWAMEVLRDLHHVRRVTPRELSGWHYDEISAAFREGRAAMVCDWPGSYHLYRNPSTSVVAQHLGLARLPAGPAGVSAAYGGCHSFAIPRTAQNPVDGAELLRYLTRHEAQLGEARLGSIPCRRSALATVRAEGDADATARWQLLADTEATMIVPPRFAMYPPCEDALWRAAQRAMVGEWSPEDALHRAAEEIAGIVGVDRSVS